MSEYERRRAANRAGGPRTFVCACGHSFSAHALVRDSTPSAPRLYYYSACQAESCNCDRFLSEYDQEQGATRPERTVPPPNPLLADRPRGHRARREPEPVEWGLTLCHWRHCVELAVCRLDGWPYCLDHAEDEWERAAVRDLAPSLAGLLPALEDK